MTTYYIDCLSATNNAAGWWYSHRHHRWMVLIGADRFTSSQWAVVDDFGQLAPGCDPNPARCD